MNRDSQISIVDDDLSVREATLNFVRAMGLAAEMFPCAEDFLGSEAINKTSCLIADMRMPGMSGLELHNRLVASGTAIPTILITAFPDARDEAHARESGITFYLAKPFDKAELLTCIHSILEIPGFDPRE
jgi:FixJ family two-component response regulator